tara:strand:+ start:224 stop:613 length:390 start_codon:yes stop_codon:yes gene_type:complete
MGTRLYPESDNPRILEKLAGVRIGTIEKLKIVKDAQYSFENNPPKGLHPDVIAYAFFTLMSDTQFDTLDTFLMSGWGKFDLDLIKPYTPAGGTSDPDLAEKLLRSATNFDPTIHDVEDVLDLCKGVCWH